MGEILNPPLTTAVKSLQMLRIHSSNGFFKWPEEFLIGDWSFDMNIPPLFGEATVPK